MMLARWVAECLLACAMRLHTINAEVSVFLESSGAFHVERAFTSRDV